MSYNWNGESMLIGVQYPHKDNRWPLIILLGDTPRVAAEFLKYNFNVKFESRKIKIIVCQH